MGDRSEQPQRRHVELYRDTLHALFPLLTLKEMVLVSGVCKAWFAAALSLKPRGECLTRLSDDDEAALLLAQSPLRRHVKGVGSEWSLMHHPSVLKVAMPHLEELHVEMALSSADQLELPPSLRILDIRFVLPDESGDGDQLVLAAMQQIVLEAPLLAQVDLWLDSNRHWRHSRALQPLTQLASLTDLTIANLKEDQTAVELLRSMRDLKRLNTGHSWTRQSLEWLLAGDQPRPALEELLWLEEITDETAPLLVRLPSLTKLAQWRFDLSDPGVLLAHLPQLTSLQIKCKDSVDIELCVAAIAHCTQLTLLLFSHQRLTDAHMCTLLPRLPKLADLNFYLCAGLASLRCLSQTTHLSRTLRTLQFETCQALPATEVSHLRSLGALTELLIERSFGLDEATISSLTPSSPDFAADCWPELKEFEYTPPGVEE